jgi:hypothetical protein
MPVQEPGLADQLGAMTRLDASLEIAAGRVAGLFGSNVLLNAQLFGGLPHLAEDAP